MSAVIFNVVLCKDIAYYLIPYGQKFIRPTLVSKSRAGANVPFCQSK